MSVGGGVEQGGHGLRTAGIWSASRWCVRYRVLGRSWTAGRTATSGSCAASRASCGSSPTARPRAMSAWDTT